MSLKSEVCDLQKKVGELTRQVYRLSRPAPGVNFRRFLEAPDAVPHDDVQKIFVGPRDPVTGMPTHPNAPTTEGIEPDFTFGGPENQQEMWSWITFDEPTYLRDTNGNTGERGGFWIGICGGTPSLQPGHKTGINTASADRGLMDVVLVPPGTHLVYGALSDLSANGGFQVQESLDETSWANIPSGADDGRLWSEPRVVECQTILACDPTPDGWEDCPPEVCTPVHSPADSSSDATPSALEPIADNDVDDELRDGKAGTTGEFSDAGHSHPVRRQANPGDPVLTLTGTGSITQQVILDRESDEESYAFKMRVRVSHLAGNGWDYLNVPTIAGFQQPEIYGLGNYRSQSISPQIDNNQPGNLSLVERGAAPIGPYMGKEVHEWSSTRRVYNGFYRREVDYVNYIEFWVRYTRL